MRKHATIRDLVAIARTPLSDIQKQSFDFLTRCLIERKGTLWQAFTLEFGLAVQGESEADVRRKLESVLSCYLADAIFGDDREYASDLLTRRAIRAMYVRYYAAKLRSIFHRDGGGEVRPHAFSEALALDNGMCSPC